MKALDYNQQIALARVLGHLSLMIESDDRKREQQEQIRVTAEQLCPVLNLAGSRPLDMLWSLAGWPEEGFDEAAARAYPERLAELAAPLRRLP